MSIARGAKCGWNVDYMIEENVHGLPNVVMNCHDTFEYNRGIFSYGSCQAGWDDTEGTELAQNCPEQCKMQSALAPTCGQWDGNGHEDSPSVTDSICPDDPLHEFDICYPTNINAAQCNQDPVIPYFCAKSCLQHIAKSDRIEWVQDKMICEEPTSIHWPYEAEDCCDDPDFKWANGDCWNITEEDSQEFYDKCTREGTDSCAASPFQCTMPGYAGEIARKHCPRSCQIYVVGYTPTSQENCHTWGNSCDGGYFPDISSEDPTDPEIIDPVDPTEPEVIDPVDPTEPEVIDPVDPTEPEVIDPVDPTEPEVTVPVETTPTPTRPPYVPKPIPQTKPLTRPTGPVTEEPVTEEIVTGEPEIPIGSETTSTTSSPRGPPLPPPVGPPPVGPIVDEDPTEAPQDEESDTNTAVIAGATAGVAGAAGAAAAAYFKLKKPSAPSSTAGDVDVVQELEERDAVASVNDEMFL